MNTLERHEKESPLWMKIKLNAEAEIAKLHGQLENAKSWDEALRLQGTIRAYRGIILAEKTPVKVEPHNTEF